MAWIDIDTVAINATTISGRSIENIPYCNEAVKFETSAQITNIDTLITWLKSKGAFNYGYFCYKFLYSWGSAGKIEDCPFGEISLAAATLEMFHRQQLSDQISYFIRITTLDHNIDSNLKTTGHVFTYKYSTDGMSTHKSWTKNAISSDLTQNSNNMQLTDYQSTNGGGVFRNPQLQVRRLCRLRSAERRAA